MSADGEMAPLTSRGFLPVALSAALALILFGILLHVDGLDRPWILLVHQQAPQMVAVLGWSCVTVLGLGSVAIILVLAADRSEGHIAALLLPTFILGAVLTHLPKWLVAAPRPAGSSIAEQLHVIGQAYKGSVSMPSGHALTAGATALLLCLALGRRRPLAQGLILLAGAIVAWSRVVVGAHWPSDVFVGAGLGLLAVVLALQLIAMPRLRQAYDALVHRIRTKGGQFAVAAVELAAAVALLTERTGYPAGRPMVMLLALVAAGSALLRCRFALATARRAPLGPT